MSAVPSGPVIAVVVVTVEAGNADPRRAATTLFISEALLLTKGNQTHAAKLLGIHRNTLQRKLVEYKLEQPKVRRKPARRVAAPKKASKVS